MGIRTAPEILRKTPREIVYRDADFTSLLAPGEVVTDVRVVDIFPPGLVEESRSFGGTNAQVLLSGGKDETAYDVLMRVTTSAGQTLDGLGRTEVSPA